MGSERGFGEPQGSLVGAACDEDLRRVPSGARVPCRLGPEEPGDLQAVVVRGPPEEEAAHPAPIRGIVRAGSSASKLARPLNLTVAAVVQHLQVLEEGRLVETEKAGRVRTCRLDPEEIRRVERWISDGPEMRRSGWGTLLERLGAELGG